ncbi:hypothetical protein DIS24_g4368 [Lasiodiplodia hormozganensis]|uniref:Uncharacterized protein n=1 Tax=Lasiodiplodia hormozganensis TaxID=869390 RepID=A0AA40D168_9PEZI|nr:hypothetical protein DIS24_g4368 [Lasiodiplodia hormozganensis]
MVVQGLGSPTTRSLPQPSASSTPIVTVPQPDPVLDAIYTLLGLTSQAPRTQCSPTEYSVAAAPAPLGVSSSFGKFYQITRRTPCMGPGTMSITARMKLDDEGHVVTWKDRRWVDFGDWVSVFPPLQLDPIGLGSPLWKQRYLWHRSGKCFPLLAFPRELRDNIYEACATFHYLTPDFEGEWGRGWNALPYSDYTGSYLLDELLTSEYGPRGTLVRTEREDGGRILNGAVCPLSLLLVNRQVYEEFKEMMWKTLDFRFPASQASSDVIWGGQRLARAVSTYTELSRITLELPILDWIKLLGIPLRQQPTDHWREFGQLSPIAQLLQTMNLSHLTIYIHHQVGYLAERRYKNVDSPLHSACPHVLVGYIILYASTVFSMIPHVQVMGCVSSRMAAQFQQLHRERHTRVTPTLTQWDIIGPSSYLTMIGRSWMDHGLYTLDPMEV